MRGALGLSVAVTVYVSGFFAPPPHEASLPRAWAEAVFERLGMDGEQGLVPYEKLPALQLELDQLWAAAQDVLERPGPVTKRAEALRANSATQLNVAAEQVQTVVDAALRLRGGLAWG